MNLREQLLETIASGLKRKTLTKCSKWSEEYVVLGGNEYPGPLRFKHFPWLKEMHDSEAAKNVGQKAAQMGYTTTVMNRTFYNIDIKHKSVLYLLPTKTPDATDFSSTKFDPLLELSSHLAKMFSDVRNVHTKRAGSATLYIRGSNSRSGLKGVSTQTIVFDEYDEMNFELIDLARTRSDGFKDCHEWLISTPTVPTVGISKEFEHTTKEHFFFICPYCSKLTELIYPDSLVICGESLTDDKIKDTYIICKECKHKLPHEEKEIWLSTGQWVPTGHKDYENRGFYINQMYSPTIDPPKLAHLFIKAQTSTAAEQEFFNSKMGLPHVSAAARIDEETINKNIKAHKKGDRPANRRLVTMGIDIGKWLHYEVDEWILPGHPGPDLNMLATCKLLTEGKCLSFDDLHRLMHEWQPIMCVIDSRPETRKAYEFACKFYGHVKMCYYGNNVSGKQISVNRDENSHSVTVDRTSWLDLSLGRFPAGTILLPCDLSDEYKKHVMACIRVYRKDRHGHDVASYVNEGDDHFCHARNYSEIALPLAVSMTSNMDIGKLL